MTMMTEYSVPPSPENRGRNLIFTPERIDQIYNLRERGKSVQEIAEIIGCTVGTLRVRCSQLGISLRYAVPTIMQKKTRNGGSNEPEFKPVNNGTETFKPVEAPPQAQAQISLSLSYNGRTKTIPFNIPAETIASLMIMAELHNMPFSEFLPLLLTRVIESNFVLDPPK